LYELSAAALLCRRPWQNALLANIPKAAAQLDMVKRKVGKAALTVMLDKRKGFSPLQKDYSLKLLRRAHPLWLSRPLDVREYR
jgi:hypothetical protein